MSRTSDVIVLGLGAMGSAIAGALAEQGRRVIAFDAFTPPHTQGSSHGHSRIYRQAYWEDPRYVHLLLRARELWEKLERESGHELLRMTGGLMLGPRDGQLVRRSAESARQYGLAHEILSTAEIRRRWPVFQIGDDTIGLLEENAGYLEPELCIRQQILQADRLGADLHCDEPVLDFQTAPGSVTVRTALATYSAGHLVVAAGPWAPQVLAEPALPLRVTRQVVFWFEPTVSLDAFRPERLPVYLFETAPDELILYGFPLTGPDGEGVKIGIHGIDEGCTPETVE
ncbi:MAG TPA: N-methyl-L-tryptophan oxidase, partial [Acidobacteriaceae bacterium]|nr:N-methyl-L-tryptophan oxidase [Acidobacteriaceae bacterium]